MGRCCWFIFVLLQAVYAFKPYCSGDTALAKKCEMLNMKTTAAFYGRSCFATTSETYRTNLKDWHTLHRHCKELMGYKGRLAFIRSREQIEVLEREQVIETSGRYYIGAKQDPPSDCGGSLCKGDRHKVNWYYIDDEGKKQGKLNGRLWLHGEPNNEGDKPPENIVTLENLGRAKLGFNDGNGEAQNFPLLCEYEDVLDCKEGYTLIGTNCYKAFLESKAVAEARKTCENDGGFLASVHNDRMNQHLAKMARLATDADYMSERSHPYGEFLLGLQWNDGISEWRWDDRTDVDYFRWFAPSEGSSVPLGAISKGVTQVVLHTSTNTDRGEGRFGYWNLVRPSASLPFICQIKPTVTID